MPPHRRVSPPAARPVRPGSCGRAPVPDRLARTYRITGAQLCHVVESAGPGELWSRPSSPRLGTPPVWTEVCQDALSAIDLALGMSECQREGFVLDDRKLEVLRAI